MKHLSNATPLLETRNLSLNYGVIPAVKGLNIKVWQGKIVCLIGANGAGKTTTLRGISGILVGREGEILFQGKNITKAKPDEIVNMGISQAPEGRGIFSGLTVTENLKIGAFSRRSRRKEIMEDREKVFRMFPILQERKNQLAGTLSGGEQQMLSIARALMARPKLLLLDEPSMGLAPKIVKEIFQIVKEINRNGTSILLVEQNAKMALLISDYGYILETGAIVSEGAAAELKGNDFVQKVYLGVRQHTKSDADLQKIP